MPLYDIGCDNGHEELDVMLKINEFKQCSTCGGPTHHIWKKSGVVVGDDIPGGVLVAHGICNDDGTPKRYYSYSEMAKAAAAKGLVNTVRHAPEPGTDKSKFTTRWDATPQFLTEAEVEAHRREWWKQENAEFGTPIPEEYQGE